MRRAALLLISLLLLAAGAHGQSQGPAECSWPGPCGGGGGGDSVGTVSGSYREHRDYYVRATAPTATGRIKCEPQNQGSLAGAGQNTSRCQPTLTGDVQLERVSYLVSVIRANTPGQCGFEFLTKQTPGAGATVAIASSKVELGPGNPNADGNCENQVGAFDMDTNDICVRTLDSGDPATFLPAGAWYEGHFTGTGCATTGANDTQITIILEYTRIEP